jgi:hypothetical protein
MTHLAREEVLRWRDAPDESQRARIVGHLAACDSCGATYAELVRTRPLEPAAERLDISTAQRQGYAARRPWLAAYRPALLAAGLVVAVAGVLLLSRPPSDGPPLEDGVRGALIALEPAGSVSAPIAFRWASPVAAPRYEVQVHDASGALVHKLETTRETVGDPAVDAKLQAGGRYTWTVAALGGDGRVMLSSAPQPFVVARAP